jgi:AraC family transcriptional regulator
MIRAVKRPSAGWPSLGRVKETTRSIYETAVRRAVAGIAAQLDEALDLRALGRAAALSPLHFHRVFRGMVGETPLELHRRLRLERAAFQLATSEVAVTQIAFDAGYETHEAFTRAFQKAHAVSPSTFRRRMRTPGGACPAGERFELAARCGVHFVPPGADGAPAAPRAPTWHLSTGESFMNVEIVTMPEIYLATLRHVGPYHRISEAFARLGALASRAGLTWQADTAMIAVYHDDPEATPAAELRSDAAFSLPAERAVPEGCGALRLPAGRYACFTHVGPYGGLGDAWARLMGEWLPRSGHRIGPGHGYELYQPMMNGTTSDPIETKLYLPLA